MRYTNRRLLTLLTDLVTTIRYFTNGLSSLGETYREYSLARTDDLIRFWRSKVKVTLGCRGGKGIRVSAGC